VELKKLGRIYWVTNQSAENEKRRDLFLVCFAFTAVKICTAVANDIENSSTANLKSQQFVALYYENFWFQFFVIDQTCFLVRDVIRFHNIWQLEHKLNATFLVLWAVLTDLQLDQIAKFYVCRVGWSEKFGRNHAGRAASVEIKVEMSGVAAANEHPWLVRWLFIQREQHPNERFIEPLLRAANNVCLMPFTWPRGSLAQLLNPKYTISRHSALTCALELFYLFSSHALFTRSRCLVCVWFTTTTFPAPPPWDVQPAARRAALFAAVFDLLTSGGTRS